MIDSSRRKGSASQREEEHGMATVCNWDKPRDAVCPLVTDLVVSKAWFVDAANNTALPVFLLLASCSLHQGEA
jgi:hypothetical protein